MQCSLTLKREQNFSLEGNQESLWAFKSGGVNTMNEIERIHTTEPGHKS